MDRERDLDIYERRKNGETLASLAKQFSLTPVRVADIVRDIEFCESNPLIAKDMPKRLIGAAAALWSRGYSVSKR